MPILPGNDPKAVQTAAALLAAGELVAFPTETVYGLGARADDDAAVARIFAAKGRPADHPLIVHVADVAAAPAFAASVSAAAQRLMAAFWPGPLTVIVPRRAGLGAAAAGGQASIGLRLPAHPVALALLREAARLGVPGVAAPSANRYGRVSPTTAAHVQQEFGAALTVLDGGACEVGIESAIVDCTREQPALLRPGRLARAQLEDVLGDRTGRPRCRVAARPGHARLALRTGGSGAPARCRGAAGRPARASRPGRPGPPVVGVYSRFVPAGRGRLVHRVMPADAAAAAHELFAVLREFDAAGVSAIWVEQPPPGPEWDGVRDRLARAAAA